MEERILIPDAGKVLTNGEVYSTKVYLGPYDSPNNWRNVPEEEVPEEISDTEALAIITGKDE